MTGSTQPGSVGRCGAQRRRALAGVALIATLVAIGSWCATGIAQAAITTFAMSPTSGPSGTVVHVSGTGCVPGLVASSDSNFVTVTATTLDLYLHVPVGSNGSWQATFTVPSTGDAGLAALAAPVATACVSSDLEALSTVYTPQTFSVTASTATPPTGDTTPTGGTKPTGGDPTPTTGPHHGDGGTAGPTPHGHAPGPVSTPGSSAPTGEPILVGVPDNVRDGISGVLGNAGTANKTAAQGDQRDGSAAAATLQPADLGASLASSPGSGSGGLGWIGWSLLLLVAVAALSAAAWWHSRPAHQREPVGETT
jgi:hypothetical protein